MGAPTHFVLYLNFNTFADEDGEGLAEQVRLARASKLPIVMPHENDPDKGGCQFERFFATTPPDLIRDGLYKKLAFPCFPGKIDRLGSLAMVAKLGLGFVESVPSLKDSRAVECFTEVASCGVKKRVKKLVVAKVLKQKRVSDISSSQTASWV